MSVNPAASVGQPGKEQLKGRHAFLWFAAFFSIMFAVNGIFVWTAVATFPGEDTEKSYLAGIDYNAELNRRAHQAHSGWTSEIGLSGSAPDLVLHVRLKTRDGQALPAKSALLLLRHPADRNLDQTLELVPLGKGEYSARLGHVAAGHWHAEVDADVNSTTEGLELHAVKTVRVP